ncbi:hypothetical protein I3842_02G029600 [Carya illinoinensis]|uniref:Uncharacterized protein n=1 Tax=Carya illinoinensis TaxID=32201 RepID=A0A922FRL3_CARIL|nr:hypothetical protein I3842_02G029600 [Carya illinoinensis]
MERKKKENKKRSLLHCGKSCRRWWTNYLQPDIKRGPFTPEEEKLVIQLLGILGNRWAAIACQLPGRIDNEIKNLWNTHLKKRLNCMGLDPQTHEPWESARLEAEARLSRESLLFNPVPVGGSDSDYFLRIWNLEVGESFRKFSMGEKTLCQNSVSQSSSSTKCGSISPVMTEIDTILAGSSATGRNQNEDIECKSFKSYTDEMMAANDSSSFDELEDSSDNTIKLLFDFPINNDMSFLEEDIDKYAMPPAMLTENSFICPL